MPGVELKGLNWKPHMGDRSNTTGRLELGHSGESDRVKFFVGRWQILFIGGMAVRRYQPPQLRRGAFLKLYCRARVEKAKTKRLRINR